MVEAPPMKPMKKIVERDHEAQRCAWAVGWFLSLLKARRKENAPELERAQTGLEALGIRVLFEEDAAHQEPTLFQLVLHLQ